MMGFVVEGDMQGEGQCALVAKKLRTAGGPGEGRIRLKGVWRRKVLVGFVLLGFILLGLI